MAFIGKYWSEQHVLSKSHKIMEWQHSGTCGRDYDFVIAFDNHKVIGCIGFILTSRFDSSLLSHDTLWLALWKIKNNAPSGLGMNLYNFLIKNVNHSVIGVVGTNSLANNIYRALGFTVGSMEQHYVLHPYFSKFNIAKVPKYSNRISATMNKKNTPILCEVNIDASNKNILDRDIFNLSPENIVPRKSLKYYINRYINNSILKYYFFSIMRNNIVIGLLVMRLVKINNGRVLRIVDMYGASNALCGIAKPLQKLLELYNAEYVDFYQYGINKNSIKESGFLTLQDEKSDNIIIPNFFEPFQRKNIKINWAYKLTNNQRIVIHKGDGDQDRPNLDK
jgi:hypothetical protein